MAVPELYWYGREGKWFGMRQFVVYMLDGVVQVRSFCPKLLAYLIDIERQSAIIYFLILYTYFTTSARTDGWQVALYEFSTVRRLLLLLHSTFLINDLHSGHGLFCCLHGQFLQWAQYKCLDWLGFLRCIYW